MIDKDMELLHEQIEKDRVEGLRKKVLQSKELDLKEKRVDQQYSDLVKNQEETAKAKGVNFGKMSIEEAELLIARNADYLEAAKHPMPFICSEFDTVVPFFRKNLILMTAASGSGKSTSVANMVYNLLGKKNPATGKDYRILVLTNEEAPEDFYNRITCFVKGWKYVNHDKFTDEQRSEFDRFIKVFAREGNLNVVGDVYEGVSGHTTSVEGIMTVFDNLMRDNEIYDAVILDYYQNVTKSREKPDLNEYEAQRLLSNEFDRIKNIYPGAIVVMAQIDPLKDDEDTTPYNIRFKGTKLIITKSTFICEIIPERDFFRSRWRIYKSRFTEFVGKELFTGFDKGRFVPYSKEFQKSVAAKIDKNLIEQKERELNIPTGEKK